MKMRIGIFSILLALGSAQAKNACSICRQYNPSKNSIILKLNNSEVEKLSNFIIRSLQFGPEPTKMATDVELYKASTASLCAYIKKECSKTNTHFTDKERHILIDEYLSQFVKGKTLTLDRNNNALLKWTKYAAVASLPIISILLHKKAVKHDCYGKINTKFEETRKTFVDWQNSMHSSDKTDSEPAATDAIELQKYTTPPHTPESQEHTPPASSPESATIIKPSPTSAFDRVEKKVETEDNGIIEEPSRGTVDNPSNEKVANDDTAPITDSGAGILAPEEHTVEHKKVSEYVKYVEHKVDQQSEEPASDKDDDDKR